MKKVNNLLKSGLIFSCFTLFSRILGFIRDMVTANLLGSASDIFVFAQRIPNLFRRLFAEGSFSQAFIPILAKYQDESKEQMRSLIASAMGWLSVITLAITVIGVLGSGYITMALANGWYQDCLSSGSDKYAYASFLLKITFPYLFFISLVALSGAVLNVIGKVWLFSFTPAILNISLIASALILPGYLGIDVNLALALGVFIGGACQLLIQIPYLYKIGFLVMPSLKITPGLKQMFKNMVPALIGASGSQLNMLVNTIVASFFIAGSMSWLYYAERLLELPLGIFGVAIATILLPTLSRKVKAYQKDNTAENRLAFRNAMDWGVKMIFIIAIPATLYLVFLGRFIIDILFFHGRFTLNDLVMTNTALICFSLATLPSMLTKTLLNGFYAHENTKTPMYVSLFTIGVNIVLNLVALHINFWFLALSTSISALLNAVIIYALLVKNKFYSFSKQAWLTLLRVVLAGIALGATLLFLPQSYMVWMHLGIIEKILSLAAYGIIGGIVYLAILYLTGFRFGHLRYIEQVAQVVNSGDNTEIQPSILTSDVTNQIVESTALQQGIETTKELVEVDGVLTTEDIANQTQAQIADKAKVGAENEQELDKSNAQNAQNTDESNTLSSSAETVVNNNSKANSRKNKIKTRAAKSRASRSALENLNITLSKNVKNQASAILTANSLEDKVIAAVNNEADSIEQHQAQTAFKDKEVKYTASEIQETSQVANQQVEVALELEKQQVEAAQELASQQAESTQEIANQQVEATQELVSQQAEAAQELANQEEATSVVAEESKVQEETAQESNAQNTVAQDLITPAQATSVFTNSNAEVSAEVSEAQSYALEEQAVELVATEQAENKQTETTQEQPKESSTVINSEFTLGSTSNMTAAPKDSWRNKAEQIVTNNAYGIGQSVATTEMPDLVITSFNTTSNEHEQQVTTLSSLTNPHQDIDLMTFDFTSDEEQAQIITQEADNQVSVLEDLLHYTKEQVSTLEEQAVSKLETTQATKADKLVENVDEVNAQEDTAQVVDSTNQPTQADPVAYVDPVEPTSDSTSEVPNSTLAAKAKSHSLKEINLTTLDKDGNKPQGRIKIEVCGNLALIPEAVEHLHLVEIKDFARNLASSEDRKYFLQLKESNPLLEEKPSAELLRNKLNPRVQEKIKVNSESSFFKIIDKRNNRTLGALRLEGAKHQEAAQTQPELTTIIINSQLVRHPNLRTLAAKQNLEKEIAQAIKEQNSKSSTDLDLNAIDFDFSEEQGNKVNTMQSNTANLATTPEEELNLQYDLMSEEELRHVLASQANKAKDKEQIVVDARKLIRDEILELNLGRSKLATNAEKYLTQKSLTRNQEDMSQAEQVVSKNTQDQSFHKFVYNPNKKK
ncbi:murein biosynthesis integral membrane protein MurJ [Psittacicella hinzii]|uniref:Probable lipid II flippase MurJ n=1 Tax=Psittacicella hinzii TaxID=2028575 RepID=A0A3A1YAM4_9GAMM|nr:murein biosynthesis integral membrane protein MurJ [Psittacicella hinzii]RIY35192.1 murein biosynthesis integral membrane protein MurJ [Psittacicella hinzii]